MKPLKVVVFTIVGFVPMLFLIGASKSQSETHAAQIERGKYLVGFGDCSACHTPLKFGPNGPEPDMTRYLSGHPEGTKLPPADLKPGPWFAATAGMTAWTGPWGISYAANLTPEKSSGMGIWTEEMFIKTLRTGKHMGAGRPILPPMPWRASASLSDDDLKAIFAFLQTIPAVTNHVSQPVDPKGEVIYE